MSLHIQTPNHILKILFSIQGWLNPKGHKTHGYRDGACVCKTVLLSFQSGATGQLKRKDRRLSMPRLPSLYKLAHFYSHVTDGNQLLHYCIFSQNAYTFKKKKKFKVNVKMYETLPWNPKVWQKSA